MKKYNSTGWIIAFIICAALLITTNVHFFSFSKKHYYLDIFTDSCRSKLEFDGYLSRKGDFFIITRGSTSIDVLNRKVVF